MAEAGVTFTKAKKPKSSGDTLRKLMGLDGAATASLPTDPFAFDFPVSSPTGPVPTTSNPEMPDMPAAGGSDPFSVWQRFLELAGGGKYEGGPGGWTQIGDQFFRRGGAGKGKVLGRDIDAYGRVTQSAGGRGFDLFGIAPQTIYWENLEGSGIDNLAANRRTPDYIWGAYRDQGAGMPSWLQQQLATLQSVWGQFGDSEQQLFLDRLLKGTGLPAYLQKFQAARPQWINDYIAQTFKV